MSIGAVAANGVVAGNKGLNYGQGYGNYQNQNNAEDKTSQNNKQFSMNHSANTSVDKNSDMFNPADQASAAAENKKVGEYECQTCKNRKYSDVSSDSGVSFQTPTKVSPENAASAVMGHEQEHVTRNQAKAEREDRKVVSQSVMIHNAICPECGKSYVSGGTTRTVTKGDSSGFDEKAKETFAYPTEEASKAAAEARGVGTKIDEIA